MSHLVSKLIERSALLCRNLELWPQEPEDIALLDMDQNVHERLLRWLLILFQLSGRRVYIPLRFQRRLLSRIGLVVWHPNLIFIAAPYSWFDWPLLVTDSVPISKKGKKTIQLVYDYGPRLRLESGHYAMPFTMHAQLYGQYEEHKNLQKYRSTPRTIRTLFAGQVDKGYHNPLICDVCLKLSRYEVIEHLKTLSGVRIPASLEEFRQSMENLGPKASEILLLGSRFRLNQKEWLSTVARTDFLLALCGVTFPLSHAAVEALAVGTIPITNYPDWFHPPLEHRVNCMAFSTLQQLEDILAEIRTMDTEQIGLMRRNAIAYYEEHLNPARFVERMLEDNNDVIYLHMLDESPEAVHKAMVHAATLISEV